ncbi:hypothetical protein GCG54_00003304 [Colletotrichum gloeosporioides]|uniref:Uncharacterized protein n=1 Tax=Colletotrichum gloeosporioides TaxID=474922 RepID=A0A8H4CEQ4_COLGL|nr:uncharacterized protein GCG54_00003304 [Colletotrichum gloeosporioides]KAF3802499.1 hypothetical protein GCG54_00003304 [Colletotrichum gloeosporioides]
MKSAFALAPFAPLFVLAAPPACLLASLGQQGVPGGVEYICEVKQKDMLGNLTATCDAADLQPAYKNFASTCAQVGIEVAQLPAPSSSPSPSPTPSATSSDASSIPQATGAPSTTISTPSASTSKPASAAAAIAPHALLFTVFGLSTTGLFSIVFL